MTSREIQYFCAAILQMQDAFGLTNKARDRWVMSKHDWLGDRTPYQYVTEESGKALCEAVEKYLEKQGLTWNHYVY